jgi:hypothetical protein
MVNGTVSAESYDADGKQQADEHVVISEMLTAYIGLELKADTSQRGADGSHEDEMN